MRAVLRAGERLRQAQSAVLGGGSGDKLREASAAERDAVRGAAERAADILGERGTPTTLERVKGSLHAAAGDDDVRAAIERGRLTRDHEPVGLGTLGGASLAGPGQRNARGAERQAKARQRLAAARQADRQAQRRVATATKTMDRRRVDAEHAREALEDAEADLSAAERDAREAAAELSAAEAVARRA
jgi:hypothetical protein